jgi:hypothetical protein
MIFLYATLNRNNLCCCWVFSPHSMRTDLFHASASPSSKSCLYEERELRYFSSARTLTLTSSEDFRCSFIGIYNRICVLGI